MGAVGLVEGGIASETTAVEEDAGASADVDAHPATAIPSVAVSRAARAYMRLLWVAQRVFTIDRPVC